MNTNKQHFILKVLLIRITLHLFYSNRRGWYRTPWH